MVDVAGAIAHALAQLGDPYEWGSEGPAEYDCSGLLWDAYRSVGVNIPRTTSAMMGPKSNLTPIRREDLQAGDFVFSNWTGSPSSHVAMYLGDGRVIEAPQEGDVVKITTFGPNYQSHADAYRRAPGVAGGSTAAYGDGGGISIPGPLGDSLRTLGAIIPKPETVTDALTNVGTGMTSVAQSAVGVGRLANLATQAFLPSNLLRGAAFLFGMVFILIGVWFLALEVRDSGA